MHMLICFVLALALALQLALAAKTTYTDAAGETVVASLSIIHNGQTRTLVLSTIAADSGNDSPPDANTVPPTFHRTSVTAVTVQVPSGTIQDASQYNQAASSVAQSGPAQTAGSANGAERARGMPVGPILFAVGGVVLGALLI